MTRLRSYLRPRPLIIGAVLLAALGLAAQTMRTTTIDVARPESDVTVQVFGLGTVEARIASRIGFAVPGTVKVLHADQGDLVPQGTVLARLDADEQIAKVAAARANVEKARANVGMAQAAVLRARALKASREQTNRRRQTLTKSGNVSEEAAQDAQALAEVAAADLTVAQSEVSVAEAAVRDAEAQLDLAQVLLTRFALTAPYDARVNFRHREAGSVVNPGEAVFTLFDPSSVWVLAYVDEALAGGLRLGQTAEIKMRSLPAQVFSGRIVRIDIESDRVSEERRVYIACESCPADIHLGEQAETLITVAHLDQALLVPHSAVQDFNGSEGTIWTVEDEALAKRRVTFRHRTLDGRLEIVSGLPDGAAPVTVLHGDMAEGKRVRAEGGS